MAGHRHHRHWSGGVLDSNGNLDATEYFNTRSDRREGSQASSSSSSCLSSVASSMASADVLPKSKASVSSFQQYLLQARSAGRTTSEKFIGALVPTRSPVNRGDLVVSHDVCNIDCKANPDAARNESQNHASSQGPSQVCRMHKENDFFSSLSVAMREIEFGH